MDNVPMESVKLVESATLSIAQLNNYGLVGTLLAILISFAAIALWYLAKHCEKRTDAAISAYKDESAKNNAVIEKNTEAFYGVQIALTELKGKIKP